MKSRLKSRLIGASLLALGAGGSMFLWYQVLAQENYLIKASVIFPFVTFLGLSLFLYPASRSESLARYGTQIKPWKMMPRGQKALIIIGLIAAISQWAFFSGQVAY